MDQGHLFITLGALFLAGLAADVIGRRTPLPRVTLLLACGILAGRAGFDLIPAEVQEWYEFLSVAALTMVAFLLGSTFTPKTFAARGRPIMVISLTVVVATIVLVAAGLWALGVDPRLALILGAVATATDPAATSDALSQGGVKGGFADTVRGIVAIDDAWGLIAFSFVIVLVGALDGAPSLHVLLEAVREIGGAALVGAAVGFPAAYLTGRLSGGDPLRTEALGVVFLTAGLALWLDVSFLLAGMTAGTIVVNFARHHTRAFHEIENMEWPFMVLFFVLAGAAFEPEHVTRLGLIGVAYLGFRVLARLAGGWVGAIWGRAPVPERPWYGIALLPQAGVAVGMALVAAEEFPDLAETILSLTIASTVIFEIIGPIGTIWAASRVRTAQATEG